MTPPPSDAAEILKLIENVDPSDEKMMDEIDREVYIYLGIDQKLVEHLNGDMGEVRRVYKEYPALCPPYSKSRDALKAIRPEGWHVCGHYALATALGYVFSLYQKKAGGVQVIAAGLIKTEELAELHAIIQSIAHERTQQ